MKGDTENAAWAPLPPAEAYAGAGDARDLGPGDGFDPNFDFGRAPTPTDPQPNSETWHILTTAEFTQGFVAPSYAVDGVIQRGRLYTLTAPTGSGKTALLLLCSTCISSGAPFCGRDVEPGDVLFLAGENPDDVRARMIGGLEAIGVDPRDCRVHFIPGTFSIRRDMARLAAVADKLPNLVLVIVDTFAAFFDGQDENANAQVLDFARVARRLTELPSKPAVVLAAHPIKNATRTNLVPKGGSSLVNEIDGNLTAWNDGGLITLHWQAKIRGPDFDPLAFELQRYESERIVDARGRRMPTVVARPVLTARAVELCDQTKTRENRALTAIRQNGAITTDGLAAEIGCAKSTAHGVKQRLIASKWIKKRGRTFVLTPDGEAALDG